MYLAIVVDVYSRKIIGWAMSKRMTVDLVERVMQMAITLRMPDDGRYFTVIAAHNIPVSDSVGC